MSTSFRWILAVTLLASSPAIAQVRPQADFRGELPGWASLSTPLKIDVAGQERPTPTWCREGLLTSRPSFPVLARTAHHGPAAFDPETGAWYASAEGTLVRVDADRLTVVVEGVQGVDVDVRGAHGLAVTREPDDTIVLWRFGSPEKRVLLRGPQFFNPRFSPDGQTVLVSESRARGGHFWLVTLDGKATDLGQGNGPAWLPDGKRLVFVRTTDDGHVIRASSVHLLDVATRRERVLLESRSPALLAPAVSLDGRQIAFAAAAGGLVLVAPLRLNGEGR